MLAATLGAANALAARVFGAHIRRPGRRTAALG